MKVRLTHSSTAWSRRYTSNATAKRISLKPLSGAIAIGVLVAGLVINPIGSDSNQPANAASAVMASTALRSLAVKGRAPKTGYERSLFSDGWGDQPGGCDTRNFILKRDFVSITMRAGESCMVATGTLRDPYTGKLINFIRGVKTSMAVQIDHVVAVSDAWQKGAQQLSSQARYTFYNDPLNLLAVDGPTNSAKGDGDAATWLPPNKAYRCAYVARQVAVKVKYKLWITSAEKTAIAGVLAKCPKQPLPTK